MPIGSYEEVNKRGGSIATTNAGAIGGYLHRTSPILAKIIMSKIRESYGGYSKFSMPLSENYTYEKGEKIIGAELTKMQEFETAIFFSNLYGEHPSRWLNEARRVVDEFY